MKNRTLDGIDLRRNWRDSGIPPRHRDTIAKALETEGEWKAAYDEVSATALQGATIVLLGKRGTGKTQIAVCAGYAANQAGLMVRYVHSLEFFEELQDCFSSNDIRYRTVFQKFCECDLLIFDELPERPFSDWQAETFTRLMDKRYATRRSTILISNQRPEVFSAIVGNSVISRIHETGLVKICNWGSFRVPPNQLSLQH